MLNSIKDGTCIPVIGAGFSKNAKIPLGKKIPDWNELKDIMKAQLTTTEEDPLLIASEFESKFKRAGLMQLLEDLILIDELKPGYVHRQLVKMQDFDVICTTNFDLLLEDACRQEGRKFKQIVTKDQFVLHGTSKPLKIFKMHGDLLNHQQLVITKKDYDDYEKNHQYFSSYLITLLTTKTSLYLGFSMKDPNFRQIKEYVEKLTGSLSRKGFIVLFDPDNQIIEDYNKMNLEVIPLITNGRTKEECLLSFFEEIQKPISTKTPSPTLSKETSFMFSISANKTILFYGQTLRIRLNSQNSDIEDKININIQDQNKNILFQTNMKNGLVITDGIKQVELILKGSEWKEENEYTIYAEYNGIVASDSFRLSKPFEIVAQTDRSVYIYNSYLIFTAIVPQASIGTNIDFEILNSQKKIVQKGSIVVDSEETGIFQQTILIEGDEWRKRGEEFEIVARYGNKSASITIFTSNFGATIELDQKIYTWTDKIYLTIVAPDFAFDQDKKDSIGIEDDGKIKIFTSKGQLSKYELVETEPDSGIFVGEIKLTGFVGHPVNSTTAKKYPMGITRGSGPNDGLLSTNSEDSIDIHFQLSSDDIVTSSAKIRWNIGEILWLEPRYNVGDDAIIRVIDPDMNLDSDEIDSFPIHVWSDSDEKGIEIIVYETGTPSGIFESVVSLTKEHSSIYGKLKVSNGDKIYAKYVDSTLPPPYSNKDSLEILASAEVFSNLEHKGKIDQAKHVGFVKKIKAESDHEISIPFGSSSPRCEEHDGCYLPSEITIQTNQVVTWSNDDNAAHMVTSGTPANGPDGMFNSGLFLSNYSFTHKFTKKGVFPYYCMVHPWQTGTIIVK